MSKRFGLNDMRKERRISKGQICIVTSHNYPESIGGEETFIRQYAVFLKSKGIPFTVISSSSSPRKNDLRPIHIHPFTIPLLGFEAYSILWAFLATLGIIQLHSNKRIGVIHTVETGYGGLASVFAAWILRLPLTVHSHTRRSENLKDIRVSMADWRVWPYWALEKSIDKFVVSHASKTIAVSEEVASFLRSLGVSRARLVIVPSALDLEIYSNHPEINLKQELGLGDDAFVLGYLGRLAPLKGLEVLLDAFSKYVEKSQRNAAVLIAGDGPLRDELESIVEMRHLRGVKFLGFRSDVAGFLGSLDVFVFPSLFEGSPIALLEAMAAGCPIVASDIQSVKEVAQGCVLLFPPGDSSRLSELLLEIEANPKLRENLAASARSAILKFSTAAAMPRILESDLYLT